MLETTRSMAERILSFHVPFDNVYLDVAILFALQHERIGSARQVHKRRLSDLPREMRETTEIDIANQTTTRLPKLDDSFGPARAGFLLANSELLHAAAYGESEQLIYELFIRGADPSHISIAGECALHRARSLHIAQMLISAGAQANTVSLKGLTSLTSTIENHHNVEIKVTQLLISQCPNVEVGAQDGLTPFLLAATTNYSDEDKLSVWAWLKDAGANLSTIDDRGQTALIHECSYERCGTMRPYFLAPGPKVSLVNWLLANGVDPSVKDKFSKTAIDHLKDYSPFWDTEAREIYGMLERGTMLKD